MSSLRTVLWNLLAFGALPAWLLAGAADWLCHRRARIEQTSGSRESALHLLLYAQIAVPLLLALWLEINAGLLAFMTACVVAHMATSYRDSRYAQPLRYISPFEQMVHSWLEMLPVFALVAVWLLHLDALRSPEWWPTARAHPLPAAWRWGVLIALLPGGALIVEEYARGRRAARVRARPDPWAAPHP